MKELFFMNSRFNLLVCATIVAKHWGFTANAQPSSEASGMSGAVSETFDSHDKRDATKRTA
jgi:hypothetical protein